MKRLTLVALFFILACAAAQAQAPPAAPAATPRPANTAAATQTPATPPKPGTKIAVVIFQDTVLDSDAGKAAIAVIEKQMESMRTQLDKLSKEMQELQAKLQAAKTDAEKVQLQNDIKAKGVEGQRVTEDAQRKSDELQQIHLQPVGVLANKTIEEYAKENDIAIVVDPATQPSNIIFAAKTSDITNEVIRRMNAAYAKDPKITAPNAAAAALPAVPAAAPK